MAAVPLPGSEPSRRPELMLGPKSREALVDPNKPIDITVCLRPQQELIPGKQYSPEEFYRARSANLKDAEAVVQFANSRGLKVLQSDLKQRTIRLHGTMLQMNQAFGVQLREEIHEAGQHHTYQGPLMIPENLAGVVTAVLGLDNQLAAKSHHRRWQQQEFLQSLEPRAAMPQPLSPSRVAKNAQFPPHNGQGQTVAIIELGGGYLLSDLQTYYAQQGSGVPPAPVTVSVGGARNDPSGSGADEEVALDMQVIGGMAPGIQQVVYFAPNTDQGFLNGVLAAIHDQVNKPSVISVSWGGPEIAWTQQAMTAMDQAFQDAGALGITICVAAGDNGSDDGVGDGQDHVDFPASSPHAISCGGTLLVLNNDNSTASEITWGGSSGGGGATGGGNSRFFQKPSYASNTMTGSNMRGMPDVSGNAAPNSGFQVRVHGQNTAIGGTSAVAPMLAALICCLNSYLGRRLGFLHPALYAAAANNPAMFHDIVQGSNGTFSAAVGWDRVTGWGTPRGQAWALGLPTTTTPPPVIPPPVTPPAGVPTAQQQAMLDWLQQTAKGWGLKVHKNPVVAGDVFSVGV